MKRVGRFSNDDTVHTQKNECCSHAGSLIAINEGLGLSEVECVGRRHIEEITLRVMPRVLRLNDRARESCWIAQPVLSAVRFRDKRCSERI